MVLGVSFDSVKENAAFAKKFGFPFLLLSDPDRIIGIAYHAASDPDQGYANRISYIIDPEGKIAHAFGKVEVETHARDVLALL